MEQKVSKHYQEDRKKREQIIQLLIGEGEEVNTFRRIDEKGRVNLTIKCVTDEEKASVQ